MASEIARCVAYYDKGRQPFVSRVGRVTQVSSNIRPISDKNLENELKFCVFSGCHKMQHALLGLLKCD